MENKKVCKHNVKLAFNNDEIVSYCTKCGKILDRYVKSNGNINYYYTYPYYIPSYPYYTPSYCGTTETITISGTNVGNQLTTSELK